MESRGKRPRALPMTDIGDAASGECRLLSVESNKDFLMNAFKHFVIDEWYFSVPMFLMSLTAVALVVWRFLLNLSAKTDMDEFLPIFQEKLQKEGVESALELCRGETGMIPRKLYAAGLEASKQ